MPSESIELTKQPENPLKKAERFEEQKQAVFKKLQELPHEEAMCVARQIFGYSIEDGLVAFELAHATPEEIQASLFQTRIDWVTKHKKVAAQLISDITSPDSGLSLDNKVIESLQTVGLFATSIGDMSLDDRNNSFRLLQAQKDDDKISDPELAKQIDDYYSEFLKTRSLSHRESEKKLSSDAEELALRHLEKLEPALEGQFYKGPVVEYFSKIDFSDQERKKRALEILEALSNTDIFISEITVRRACGFFGISFKTAERKLKSARYTRPRIVYSQEKHVAIEALKGQIEDEIPQDYKIKKNPDTGEFEIKKGEEKKVGESESFKIETKEVDKKYNKFYVAPSGKKYIFSTVEHATVLDLETGETIFNEKNLVIPSEECIIEVNNCLYVSCRENGMGYGKGYLYRGKDLIYDGVAADTEDKGELFEFDGKVAFIKKNREQWCIASENGEILSKKYDSPLFLIDRENLLFAVKKKKTDTSNFDVTDFDVTDKNGNMVFENVYANDLSHIKKIDGIYYLQKGGAVFSQDGKKWAQNLFTDFAGTDKNNLYGATYNHFLKLRPDGTVDFLFREPKTLEFYEDFENFAVVNEKVYCSIRKNNTSSLFLLSGSNSEKISNLVSGIVEPFEANDKLFFFVKKNDFYYLSDSTGDAFAGPFKYIPRYESRDGKIFLFGYKGKGNGEHIFEEITLGEKAELSLTESTKKKLELLNLVENPELSKIKEALAGKKENFWEESRAVAQNLTDVIKKAPELFLNTIAPKRDRNAKVLAAKLFEKMFPYAKSKTENGLWRKFSGYLGYQPEKGRSYLEALPEDYLYSQNTFDLAGGGAEQMNDTREILSFREEVNELVVSGIYGKYDVDRKTWSKSYFPRDSALGEDTREITATTAPLQLSKVALPLPLDAKIIPTRVKGISASGLEASVKIDENSLGEVTVPEKPKTAEKVVYSFELDTIPKVLGEISEPKYQQYKKRFAQSYGKDLLEEIGFISQEEELFLSSIAGMSPKQKVMEIEDYVRALGFYDFNNSEVSALKHGKDAEEQMEIMKVRADELRASHPELALALRGKKYAGVCADFALITTVLLRKAGFFSGVLCGFRPEGKKISVKNAHATSFVVWPDAEGKNMVIPVDGTPGSSDSRMANIKTDSLREKEVKTEEITKELGEEAEKKLQEALKSIDEKDESAIRQLQNGELEKIVNDVLKYKVKNHHYRMIENLIENYWYSGIADEDVESLDGKVALQKWLQVSLDEYRETFDESKEVVNKPGGKIFLEMFEEYSERFVRGGATPSKVDALSKIQSIIDLAGKHLDPTERKAAGAVILYLKAEQMTKKK